MTEETTTTTTQEPHRTEETIVPPLPDPLQFVVHACHSYLPAHVTGRWSQGTYGLRFTENGMARVGQIFGWITGIAASPDEQFQAFAKKLAVDICQRFDWLTGYGGHHVETVTNASGNTYDVDAPRYVVELSDDGTLNGFTVQWLAAVHPDNQKPDTQFVAKYDELCCYGIGPRYRYTRSFNGGLLYSGPGHSNDLFAVTIGRDCLWGIHT